MYIDKQIKNYCFNTKDIIGIGSYGTVFQGVNQIDQKNVAIKVLKKHKILGDSYLTKALAKEIQILKKVKSQYIVQFLDTCESVSNYYIVSEFCQGGDLRKYLKQNILNEQQAVHILQNILLGYHELLANGFVHRDLKPGNILISQGIFKLADFGLATKSTPDSMMTSRVGTPQYMSPQVLEHTSYTNKSDIWSLGVLFYECLYRQIPWKEDRSRFILQAIYEKKIKFSNNDGISDQSKDFIKKCLVIDERNRMDWNEVFHHSLFTFCNFNQIPIDDNILLFNQLVFILKNSNIDIKNILKKYGDKKAIRIVEFISICQEINPILELSQIYLMFNSIKQKLTNYVELNQLEKLLIINQVDIIHQSPNDNYDEKTLEILIKNLQSSIKINQYTLKEVAEKATVAHLEELDIDQFKSIILIINKNITLQQILQLFQKLSYQIDSPLSVIDCKQKIKKCQLLELFYEETELGEIDDFVVSPIKLPLQGPGASLKNLDQYLF